MKGPGVVSFLNSDRQIAFACCTLTLVVSGFPMEIRKFEGQVSARALVADAISWDKRLLSNLESGVTWTSWTAWHCEGSWSFFTLEY